ncbi:MAG: hypothetical protein AAF665_06380 [Pseudomonadota bacterium]
MKLIHLLICSAVLLTGCTTVLNETRGSIVVDGEVYETRTRLLENSGGTFESTSVFVRNTPFSCLPDSPNDCASKVRRNRDRIDID